MIEFRGKQYSSIYYIADDYSIPLRIFKARLDCGWTLDMIVDIPLCSTPALSYTKPIYKGVAYNSYKELADTFNISLDVIAERLVAGWDITDIIEYSDIDAKYCIYGKPFSTLKEVAEFYNISVSSLRSNVIHSIMSFRDFIEYTMDTAEGCFNGLMKRPFRKDDIQYKTYEEYIISRGLPVSRVRDAVYLGISMLKIADCSSADLDELLEKTRNSKVKECEVCS